MGRPKKRPVAAIGIFLICFVYIGLALYYSSGFSLNTWINGVYCTGKTVEEVNAQLVEQTRLSYRIAVAGLDFAGGVSGGAGAQPIKRIWEINLEDAGLSVDYTENLQLYLARQNPWLWIENVTFHSSHEIRPVFIYDKEEFGRQWEQVAAASDREEAYRIVYDEAEGYALYDGMSGRLDEARACQIILEAAAAGEDRVDLAERGCYYDAPLNARQEETAALWAQIKAFQDSAPIYEMGDSTLQVDRASMASFLQKEGSDGGLPQLGEGSLLQIREEAVEEFVQDLADRYDTYGGVWRFQSTRGEQIQIQGGTYGNTINRRKETEWLEAYLRDVCQGNISGGGVTHAPAYERETFHPGGVIGDTYIEVDMGIQKLYYYEGGKLMLETDVVTGNMGRRRGTPEGVNYVYGKAKNRVLRGPGYASPVKFWMPVNGGIGIHDASWRKEFGGEIYKTNGSHGCINVESETMAALYDMVEIGTPVVMFYGDEAESDAGSDAVFDNFS